MKLLLLLAFVSGQARVVAELRPMVEVG